MKTILAILFQAYGFKDKVLSLLGRKGPCSVKNPRRPEQPGPVNNPLKIKSKNIYKK